MKIGRIILTVTLIALAMVCAFSFMMYINFSRLLDIPKEILKSGAFELSDKTYEFTFTTPKEAKYNLVLKFLLEKEGDPITRYRSGYTVNTELRDNNNNLLMQKIVDQNSIIHESWSNKECRRDVLTFNAKEKQIFKVKIAFHNENDFLNRISKEIYVEKDYDPASYPWWKLFKGASLLVFGITFLFMVGIIFLMRRKRRNH